MKRVKREEGSALVLILGVASALAILAATLVMVTANTQGATAANRTQVQAFNIAEAGLNSAVAGAVNSAWPDVSTMTFSQTELMAAFASAYPTASYPDPKARPEATVTAYDDLTPINTSVAWDSDGNGIMWVQANGTYGDKTARIRTKIQRTVASGSAIKTGVGVYAGGNVSLTGTGQIGNMDLTQNAAIYAGGNLSRTDQTCLRVASAVIGGAQEQVPSWMLAGESWLNPPPPAPGGQVVPPLDEVIPPDMVQTWVDQASTADPNGTVVTKADFGHYSYVCPYPAAKVVGNLQLDSAWTSKPKYTFNSLYVTGDFTVAGDCLTKIDRLYVGGKLTVTAGPGRGAVPDQEWGAVFVQGDVSITSGHFMTIEILATNGRVTVGSGAQVGGNGVGANYKPTLFALVGDGKDFVGQGSGSAVFNGVAYTKSGNLLLSGGNGQAFVVNSGVVSMPREPFFRGAAFAGGNVTISGGCSLAYDANVMNNLAVTETTPVLQIVPGTWQELSPN